MPDDTPAQTDRALTGGGQLTPAEELVQHGGECPPLSNEDEEKLLPPE